MSAYPKGFVPDLRRLRPWPDFTASLWRNPDLVRLTHARLAHLVQGFIGSPRRNVLYVGSGVGHIALELARQGHKITGLDVDEESVTLANRAAKSDHHRPERGNLSYEVAEFPSGGTSSAPYDSVLFCRVLHHIKDPAAAATRAAELLRPNGDVVCVDFAYDLFSNAAARWMAESRLWLSRSDCWPEPLTRTLQEETERVATVWRGEHEGEGLNTFRTMLEPLQAHFELTPVLWHPYLFWDLAAEMQCPPEREGQVARSLRDDEAGRLGGDCLHGVLFSTSGRQRMSVAVGRS